MDHYCDDDDFNQFIYHSRSSESEDRIAILLRDADLLLERCKDLEDEQSMSRKGNCLDNSPMENFFGVMKNEMFYGHEYEFKSLEELEKAMIKYIEYYNSERIMEKTKGLSPLTYRQQSFVQLGY